MTWILFRKLLRDIRVPLLIVGFLLFLFQVLWGWVAYRVTGEIIENFKRFGIDIETLRASVFGGSGKVLQSLMGGDAIKFEQAQHVMTVALVHPMTQTILCIWAVGRAAGAIAGEIDRGTMELLLAQPIRRSRVILAHLGVDAIVLPVLYLCMWAGTWTGAWAAGLLHPADPLQRVEPGRFLPGLLNAGLLMFAVSGLTMAISARGRYRGRVMGLAILVLLVMFLANVIGQLWSGLTWARPATLFNYYQPQPMILEPDWTTDPQAWMRLGVLLGAGLVGYALAFIGFARRDLPAPL